MRAKCPIIATSVTGNRELIEHDKTGLLVEPEPSKMAKAIDELLENENKRKEYADNAFMYISQNHTLEKQITGLTEIYKSLMRK